MATTRRNFIKTVGAALASSLPAESAAGEGQRQAQAPPSRPDAAASRSSEQPGRKRKVICDQDNGGPFGTDTLGMLMMLQAENIDVLGITLVTGDAWMRQGMAYTLRLLELMNRTEIPVYAGAEFPMLNTKEEALLRLQLYGGNRPDPWLGAFNRGAGGSQDVQALRSPYGKFAGLKAQTDHAARFIVNTLRQNPGEVTIYAGGPLTNLALAIALAPEIVPLTQEVVIMGTGFHAFTNTFNMFFDPEAARKVWHASWPKLSVVTVDTADEVRESDDLVPGRKMAEEIAERAQSPISDLFRLYASGAAQRDANARPLRMGDEVVAARVIDPSIFTKSQAMYVDVCSTPGPRYGDAMFWPGDWQGTAGGGRVSEADRRVFVDPRQYYMGPPPAAGLVNVLSEIDRDRFRKLFVDLLTKQIRTEAVA